MSNVRDDSKIQFGDTIVHTSPRSMAFHRSLPAAGTETIAAAALLWDGLVLSLPKPARHHTIMRKMLDLGLEPLAVIQPDDQGFITSAGRFVGREEGCHIAREAGQIQIKTGPANMLFSEDVW